MAKPSKPHPQDREGMARYEEYLGRSTFRINQQEDVVYGEDRRRNAAMRRDALRRLGVRIDEPADE
jgi:hypothetical protein